MLDRKTAEQKTLVPKTLVQKLKQKPQEQIMREHRSQEQKTLEQKTQEQRTPEPKTFLTWTCWGRECIPTAAGASVGVVVAVADNVVVGDNLFRKPVLRRVES